MMLVPHPAFPSSSVSAVEVELTATNWEDILIEFRIKGERIVIPEWRTSQRSDGLWKTTCFELFLKEHNSERYFEFNFSPSTQWAAYEFDGYRRGMRDRNLVVEPGVELDPGRPMELSVDLDFSGMPNVALQANISAVIEEQDGTMSYWALAHPPGDKPDFHHPDCFVLEIPAATQT